MTFLRSMALALAGIALGVTTSIVVAVYGWGLTARSWTVIVGVGVTGQLTATFLAVLAQREDR